MAKRGRPTKFKPEYIEQARVACAELEATDQELANLFGVSRSTIELWKVEHPEFSDTLKNAKEIADRKVELSLFKRATGYTKVEKALDIEGRPVELTKEVIADPVSMIFWLKNRQRDKWREKQDIEHSGRVDITPVLAVGVEGVKANKPS